MSELTAKERDALNTVLDVVVLTGATSDIAPYITDKASGFLSALAAVDPPLTVVPLTASPDSLDVERLRAAIYAVSVRHDWEHTTDREDRTEEIAAEYRRLVG